MPKLGSLFPDLAIVIRGVCMGAADVVPGVSGGTVALITGIYDRLVTAISRIDLTFIRLVRSGQLRDAAQHLDLRFLVTLGIGLAAGFVTMSATMHHLLTKDVQTRSITLAAFSGMIVMSAVLLARNIRGWNGPSVCTAIIGTLVALAMALADTPESASVEPSLGFIFVCGCIAICAMILPGISGSFLLVIMGKYQQVFTAVHERDLQIVALFGLGAAVGILGFSRLLKRLLASYQAATMAFLLGLMLGSLRKVWPFRNVLEEKLMGKKIVVLRDECIWPQEFTGEVWLSFALMVAGAALVLVLEKARQSRTAASGA